MFESSLLKAGDRIFLFNDLPGTPNALPFSIAKGIQLILCPSEYWNNDDDALKSYRYIFPLANFNIPCRNISICISQHIDNQDEAFSLFLLALRLVKPLPINVSGAFTYLNKNQFDENSLLLLWRQTLINSGFPYKTGLKDEYNNNDFNRAKHLYNRILDLKKHPRQYRRLLWAIIWFKEVTLGVSNSYSMLYQGLFSSLEAFFGSPSKAKILKNRVSTFLTKIYGNHRAKVLGEFIYNEYKNKRNKVSHGNPLFHSTNVKLSSPLPLKKYKELLKLHEITRITLLGFLGWNEIQLKKHSSIEFGPQKLEEFNNFFQNEKASTLFLCNKKMYLQHPYKSNK